MFDYTLSAEVDYINEVGKGLRSYQITAAINNGKSSEWTDVFNVLSYSINRNYTNFGDDVYLTVQVPLGDYTFDILPNIDTLRVQVTTRYSELTGTKSKPVRKTKEYVAICLNPENQTVNNPKMTEYLKALLNQKGFMNLELQLFEDSTYRVRMESVGGVFRNCSPMDVLTFCLSKTTQMKGPTNKDLITGVDISPGFNTSVRKQIPVEHGTKLVDLANYLHYKEGGLYSAGSGCYLQDGVWYVFPTFDIKIFSRSKKTFTVILVPGDYTASERTYRVDGDNLTFRTTGKNLISDTALAEKLNTSNGIRYVNAEQVINLGSSPSMNKVTLKRSENLTELSGTSLGTNATNAHFVEERVTSNPFKHYTDLAMSNCRYIDVEWKFGDINLFFPGEGGEIKLIEDNKVKTYRCILANVSSTFTPIEEGAVKQTFVNVIRCGFYVELAKH